MDTFALQIPCLFEDILICCGLDPLPWVFDILRINRIFCLFAPIWLLTFHVFTNSKKSKIGGAEKGPVWGCQKWLTLTVEKTVCLPQDQAKQPFLTGNRILTRSFLSLHALVREDGVKVLFQFSHPSEHYVLP